LQKRHNHEGFIHLEIMAPLLATAFPHSLSS